MNWYYAKDGQQAGPVEEAQLEELARTGQIRPETLVWREGMANWQPYSEAKPEVAQASGAARPQAVCAECGRLFPVEETIQYGTTRVCAGCKPIFMQKLAEGARVEGGLHYASIGTRFAAVFLDGIILFGVNTAINLAAGLGVVGSNAASSAHPGMTLLLTGIQIGIAMAYEIVLIGKYGATLGKRACKIHVVTADGGKVSYGRAAGRYFAKLLSGFTCLIGYIIAFFDEEKRALHDRICNTRVVVNSPSQ